MVLQSGFYNFKMFINIYEPLLKNNIIYLLKLMLIEWYKLNLQKTNIVNVVIMIMINKQILIFSCKKMFKNII